METTKKTFKGGYVFSRFPGHPENSVETIGIPETVMYPLEDTKSTSEALVIKGDRVRAGQLLWQKDEVTGNPVIATVNGTVQSVKPVMWKGKKVPLITVQSDGTADWTPVKGPSEDPSSVDAADIEETLYFAGVAALGTEGIPTRFNTSPINPGDVRHLIISHCEDDVYNADLSVIIGDRIGDFFTGLDLLRKIMPGARTYMAISRKNREWISRLSEGPFDEMVLVKPKYPQSMDSLLVETVTGKKIPAQCTAADASAVVLDPQALLHVFDAVKEGKPLIERTVALAGPGFSKPSYVKVRMGTSFGALTAGREADGENRFIVNSAINGDAVSDPDFPIDPLCSILVGLKENRTGELLSFARPGFRKHSMMHTMANALFPLTKNNDTNVNGEERACLSCGNCYNICPAGLYPTQLFKYAERDRMDEVPMRYGIFRCFDCNLCTYGCTAKIPLAEWIKKGKAKLLEDGYTTKKELAAAYGLKEAE